MPTQLVSCLSFLVQNGASVNMANAKGVSCVMIAAFMNYMDVVKFLISKGADTRQKDAQGRNALFYCAVKVRLHLSWSQLNHHAFLHFFSPMLFDKRSS